MSLPTPKKRSARNKSALPTQASLMDMSVTNVLDEGCEIEGGFTVTKSIMFKGILTGDLTVKKPGNLSLISVTGFVEGVVDSECIILMGEVKGAIRCKDIRFLPGSKFTGSLQYENMRVDRGAEVNADKVSIQEYFEKEASSE